ncbi:hypothetical protein [Lacticaseibacillus hulanensis]|uniref:hypothetical protein n=1 Tax=Lacticaseibacillus hulanensis TaxID=2493111 RepID=UPI000FD6ECF7|nr:hypothetical protein [Lacticaseibacillus hulanensis]
MINREGERIILKRRAAQLLTAEIIRDHRHVAWYNTGLVAIHPKNPPHPFAHSVIGRKSMLGDSLIFSIPFVAADSTRSQTDWGRNWVEHCP